MVESLAAPNTKVSAPCTAPQGIATATTVNDVVTGTAEQIVGNGVADQQVIA
jgi:hypothetical protein